MTFDEFWKNERMVATSYRNAAKAAWYEARRTDPAKAQILEALRVVFDSAGTDWYPHDEDRAIVENALNHPVGPDSSRDLNEEE
jgi:hypothetical protein